MNLITLDFETRSEGEVMAGSYGHVDPQNDGAWSLIENMRDAHECAEELLFIARCYGRTNKINDALEKFYAFKRGDAQPNHKDWYGKAYLATQKVMEK